MLRKSLCCELDECLQVVFCIAMSANNVMQAAAMSPDLAKSKSVINSIFGILDRKLKMEPSDMSGKTLKAANGEIEFQSVSFFHPTGPDVPILRKLSFKVRAGQNAKGSKGRSCYRANRFGFVCSYHILQ